MLGIEKEFKISGRLKDSIPLQRHQDNGFKQSIKLTASLQGAGYKLHHGRSLSGNRGPQVHNAG